MNERQDEHIPVPPEAAPSTEQPAEPARPDPVRSRARRPWRWVLGAVSIAAVSAGVIFISKRGLRKPE